jgi:outer membrane lipoprotein-sorting protein
MVEEPFMLRNFTLAAFACVVLPCALYAQSVDDVIAKYVAARGGLEKIKAVNTMRMTGKMSMGPMEAPVLMVMKRPDQVRLEFTVQGLTGIRVYDAGSGWAVMPFMGKKDAEPIAADELKELEDQADIDGPLIDYKAKGHKVELLGKDKVEGTDVYKLKLTRKNGDIDTIYLDADSYLEIKEEGKRTIRGSEQEFDTSIGDYREVGGLMFPFALDSGAKGSQERQKITIDKVELNIPVEAATFKMPPPSPPAPATTPTEDKKPPEDKKSKEKPPQGSQK